MWVLLEVLGSVLARGWACVGEEASRFVHEEVCALVEALECVHEEA